MQPQLRSSLRRRMAPRSYLVWLILAVLVTGAAAYSQGSRYALLAGQDRGSIAGQMPAENSDSPAWKSTAVRTAGFQHPFVQPLQVASAQMDHVRQRAFHCNERGQQRQDCCVQYRGARGEPSPIRGPAVEPPKATPGPAACPGVDGPPPFQEHGGLALSLTQLSISRT